MKTVNWGESVLGDAIYPKDTPQENKVKLTPTRSTYQGQQGTGKWQPKSSEHPDLTAYKKDAAKENSKMKNRGIPSNYGG